MTIDEFLQVIEEKAPPAPIGKLVELEGALGAPLSDDYRQFLAKCNGGYVGGAFWYEGPTPTGDPADAGVHHIGGVREESHFSLAWNRECYAGRLPDDLLWIADDPFGNGICLGIRGAHQGRIYFWDHEMEPDPDTWDGKVETAGNVTLIANSFTEFVAGLKPTRDG
jgi:hypothetical protein